MGLPAADSISPTLTLGMKIELGCPKPSSGGIAETPRANGRPTREM